MKLKFNPPDNISHLTENHIYLIPFDIAEISGECDGWLCLDQSHIKVIINGHLRKSYPIEQLSELKVTPNIANGMLEGIFNGEDIILCRFTQKNMQRMAEFAKSFNLFNETGIAPEFDDSDERVCKKCDSSLIEGTNICPFCTSKTFLFTKLLKISKHYNAIFVFAGFLLLLANSLTIFIPVIVRKLVDDYLVPRNSNIKEILFLVALIFFCYLFNTLINIWSMRVNNKGSSGLSNDLRNMAFSKVQALSMSSLSKKAVGDLLNRITSDTEKVQRFISDQGRWAIEQIIIFIGIAIILFVSNPKLALLLFVPVPFAFMGAVSFRKMINRRYKKQWLQKTKTNSILHDIIKGIRVVKTFGNEEREIKKFNNAAAKFAEICSDNEKAWALIFPLLGFIVTFGEFLILYFGGEAILGEKMKFGELVQFTSYAAIIYGPLRWIANIPRWFADAATSIAKLFEILEEEPDIKDIKNPRDIEIKGEIEFKKVNFGYKFYEPVLKDINIKIEPGEMIGLVGHSGTGKSTFINLVMRLYDANEGEILIDGINIKDITQRSLRSKIGVVLQETFLFAGTIYDNIAYAKPNASPQEIFAAAKIANAHDFIIKLPDAYCTKVGEQGYTLSGGERQRIAIARAILHNPSILILDEATSALDTETENQIQSALSQLIKGRTTIAIAHRLSTLKNATRLVVLEKGAVSEIGTHTELMKNKGVYYRLVMAQRQTSKLAEETALIV